MSLKLLWTGLVGIVAVVPVLNLIGLHPSSVVVQVGACIMVIGCILMWINR